MKKRFLSVGLVLVLFVCAAMGSGWASAEEITNDFEAPLTNYDAIGVGKYDFDYSQDGIQPLATGLISTTQLTVYRSSTQLAVYGKTNCFDNMSKVGFTYITIQRWINNQWTDYLTINDYYDTNVSFHSYGKYHNVPIGYTYRAICNHYAEKPGILWLTDKENIYNETEGVII